MKLGGKELVKKTKLTVETIAIMFIIVLSVMLNFANLSIEGTGNLYYAAAVRSMTMSLKNFFFVSFDPAGFISIDKPPLGFWLQTISAKIFGYSGWSILLPQALAGVISVVIIYKLVKRAFGSTAGLISAVCLAITPVFVAASRNNTVDNILILFLLLACLTFSAAVENGNLNYLMISMALVGLGFNVKMLQAYMILPALYITYLLAAAPSMRKKIIHLSISTIVLLAVSLSWASFVDAVPSKHRPYIDSSTNNSIFQLILGHNGIQRLCPNLNNSKYGEYNFPANRQILLQHMGNINGGLRGFSGGHLPSSVTRLFSKNVLSDQIVWFIPLAVLGFIASAMKEKLKLRLDSKQKQSLVLWFMWFLPEFLYFSYSTGNFHPYYLTMLAPPIAALTGIGITSMWSLFKEGGWKSWLLPFSLILSGMVQLLTASYFIKSSYIVEGVMILLIVLCLVSSVILCLFNVIMRGNIDIKLIKCLVIAAVIGLWVIPFAGSSTAIYNKLDRSIPTAGLELLASNSMQEPEASAQVHNPVNCSSKLIRFLKKNKTRNQKYLLVVPSANQGSGIIIKTGEAVMATGGFLGQNNVITLNKFKSLVKRKVIRYVMLSIANIGKYPNGKIMSWVKKTGKVVPASEYSNNASNRCSRDIGRLYDLMNYAGSSSTIAKK